MAFIPKNANKSSTNDFEIKNYPVPRSGSRKARVSLIIDMGIQERENIYDLNGKAVPEGTEGAVCRPQKPCQQVAVFADLVSDIVDYGGDIGKQQYRLLLNKSFGGNVKGITFAATPPKDANGNTIPGKKWGFHPSNLLTSLSKAVGKPEIIESMDISQLLGLPFMATVTVNEKDSGKVDKEGKPIIYRNVNFTGASEIPLDDDDKPLPVAELNTEAKCIQFETAKTEDIKFIRNNILSQIKLASNYAGSQMQKAVEEFESNKANNASDTDKEVLKSKDKPIKKIQPAVVVVEMDEDDDAPF